MTELVPIKRLIVDAGVPAMLGRGVAISWQLNKTFELRELRHTVLFGRYPNDAFIIVGTVDNDTYFEDPIDRILNADVFNRWYALKTTDINTQEHWYTSPVHAGSTWRKREWLIARDIVRQESVRLIKRRAGTRGWLLRRRFSGTRCEDCVEPETGRITDPECETCFGTGFVGGYYDPMEFWVDLNPEKLMRRLTPDQGIISGIVKTGRALAYPPAMPNDYWVSAKSGIRFKIGDQVVKVAEIEEEPLIVQIDMTPEQTNHIIYSVPIGET